MFKTQGFSCFSVAFSPYENEFIALAASQHYGIVGSGRLIILAPPPPQQQQQELPMQPVTMYDAPNSIVDCAWSELNQNQVIIACGDHTVKM